MLLLPACVGAPERPAALVAASQPAIAPSAPLAAPPASQGWQYRPATVGDWVYRADGGGTVAVFTGRLTGAALTFRCETASRRISVTRAGAAQNAMTVRTNYGSVSWPATGGSSGTVAFRAANDATLDQIAYSRGRFAIEVVGLDMLILPPWAEVARVIEDCRA